MKFREVVVSALSNFVRDLVKYNLFVGKRRLIFRTST
jgi:hypothetical protein